MVPSLDVDSFLQNGYWSRSKAGSPKAEDDVKHPKDDEKWDDEPCTPITRASFVDRPAPPPASSPRGNSPTKAGSPTKSVRFSHRAPPRVTVEDEDEALAKEQGSPVKPSQPASHRVSVEDEEEAVAKEIGSAASTVSSEEPHNRGQPDQYPIIQDVDKEKSERRFVHVPAASDAKTDKSNNDDKQDRRRPTLSEQPSAPTATERDADNRGTSRGRSSSRLQGEKSADEKSLPLRERRAHRLEELSAIVTEMKPQLSPRENRTSRSATPAASRNDGYFSPRHHRPQDDIPYSPSRDHSRVPLSQTGDGENRSPTYDRRRRDSWVRERKPGSTSPEKRQSSINLSRAGTSPTKDPRETNSSPNSRSNSFSTPHHSPKRDSYASRGSGQPRQHHSPHHSSDEDEARLREEVRRRRSSFIRSERGDSRSSEKRRSGLSSPLASPSVSQGSFNSSPSPRHATFPRERTSIDANDRERPLSRSRTSKSWAGAAAPLFIPGAIAAASAGLSEKVPGDEKRKPSTSPVKPGFASARSSTSTVSSDASKPGSGHAARAQAAATQRPPMSYRRYSEDVKTAGELPDFADCPRTKAEAGHVDWLTLPRSDNFHVCPFCYQHLFAKTEFAQHFVPAPMRPASRAIACDFGRSEWFKIAWLLTRKYQMRNLTLVYNIADVLGRSQPCRGFDEVYRTWYSLQDGRTGRAVRGFNVCHPCAKTVELLLPNLTGAFVPANAKGEPAMGTCSMHPEDGRTRFIHYWDAFETASDRGLRRKQAPDIQMLAELVGELARVPECKGGRTVSGARWRVMRTVPDLVACEACYAEVVLPALHADAAAHKAPNPVASDFHHKLSSPLPIAACVLASARMKTVLRRAMRKHDIKYLVEAVRERKARELEYHARVRALDNPTSRGGAAPAAVAAEAARAKKKWEKWQ